MFGSYPFGGPYFGQAPNQGIIAVVVRKFLLLLGVGR